MSFIKVKNKTERNINKYKLNKLNYKQLIKYK